MNRHNALVGGTTSYRDCLEALSRLYRPGSLVEGPAEVGYEREIAAYVGVSHGVSFTSGRVGLFAILRVLGIGEGDEVLIQVPTHVVVANAIRYTGAIPVYVDCDAETFDPDLEHAERLISPRTRAVIVQHAFGIPVDLDAARRFAERHQLVMIEDCVHSLGATYKGGQTGSFGHAAFFSTEETKMISTTLGGIVVTDDGDLAERLRAFRRDHCARPTRWMVAKYLAKLIGYQLLTEPRIHRYARAVYDFLGVQPLPPVSQKEIAGERPTRYLVRFSNAQAAMGILQLRRMGENVSHRRRIAEVYRDRLAACGVDGAIPYPEHSAPSWCRYPIRVQDRQAVEDAIRQYVVPGTWFMSVLEQADAPEVCGYVPGSCPNAEAAIGHMINLPTHGRVSVEDAERLADVVIESARVPSP